MLRASVWWGVGSLALAFVASARRSARRDALKQEDQRFHSVYGQARDDAAQHTPVLVFFDGTFTFSDGERRIEYCATAPGSQLLKAAAHAPIGTFTLLSSLLKGHSQARLSADVCRRLSESQRTLQDAETWLQRAATNNGLDDTASEDSVEVVAMTRELLAKLLELKRIQADDLAHFARELGPRLLRLTEHATELELAALHDATEAALRDMTDAQRAHFEVVIAGAHQARDRSLPLQYFQQRLAEAPGEERRIAYAESASSPEEARALVGTRRLDRTIASAFFGNAKRLQRDVLGDAASRLLKQHMFSRIS